MIKFVWAMDSNRVIGKNGKLPWNIKEELKHFANTTRHHTLLMGRTTFESIPKKLADRKIIVLTRNNNLKSSDSDITYTNNLDEIIKKYAANKTNDLYVCGGAKVYEATLPYVDELILTEIKKTYAGDTYFPEFDLNKFELIKKLEYIDFVVKYYKRKK